MSLLKLCAVHNDFRQPHGIFPLFDGLSAHEVDHKQNLSNGNTSNGGNGMSRAYFEREHEKPQNANGVEHTKGVNGDSKPNGISKDHTQHVSTSEGKGAGAAQITNGDRISDAKLRNVETIASTA